MSFLLLLGLKIWLRRVGLVVDPWRVRVLVAPLFFRHVISLGKEFEYHSFSWWSNSVMHLWANEKYVRAANGADITTFGSMPAISCQRCKGVLWFLIGVILQRDVRAEMIFAINVNALLCCHDNDTGARTTCLRACVWVSAIIIVLATRRQGPVFMLTIPSK